MGAWASPPWLRSRVHALLLKKRNGQNFGSPPDHPMAPRHPTEDHDHAFVIEQVRSITPGMALKQPEWHFRRPNTISGVSAQMTARFTTMAAVAALAIASLAAAPARADNIVEVAQGAGQFNTLIAAAKAAGLAGALSAPGAKTVFAPTDAAFAKLPKGTVENLLKPANKAKLKSILAYHVVNGKTLLAKDIPAGSTHVRSLNGQQLAVKKGTGVTVNGVKVVKADVKADNGVIHVIDKVLLPH
jgi:uncharacterized surface protein with fasciclin (FAS1) repeats